MNRQRAYFLLLIAFVVSAGACSIIVDNKLDRKKSSGSDGRSVDLSSAADGGLQPDSDSARPTLQLIPDTVRVAGGDAVGITVNVTNFRLEPGKIGRENMPGEGHYELLLGGPLGEFLAEGAEDFVQVWMQTSDGAPLAAGDYDIWGQLLQNDGTPFDPPVSHVFTVSVCNHGDASCGLPPICPPQEDGCFICDPAFDTDCPACIADSCSAVGTNSACLKIREMNRVKVFPGQNIQLSLAVQSFALIWPPPATPGASRNEGHYQIYLERPPPAGSILLVEDGKLQTQVRIPVLTGPGTYLLRVELVNHDGSPISETQPAEHCWPIEVNRPVLE